MSNNHVAEEPNLNFAILMIKMILNRQRLNCMYPICTSIRGTKICSKVCHCCFLDPKFQSFCRTAKCVQDKGYFQSNASNDTKMTLNATRSKVPWKCSKCLLYVLVILAIRTCCSTPNIFLRQVYRMTPNDLKQNK